MNNPWKNISIKSPYVLKEDQIYIDSFNAVHKKQYEEKKKKYGEDKERLERIKRDYDELKINTNYTPEPRLGNINAPVIFLQLNPSYSEQREDKNEIKLRIESLNDEKHYHVGAEEGAEWWGKRLKQLAKDVGGYEALSQKICSIEFFPYRSKKFDHAGIRLPSQEYTFSMVRKGLKNEAIFIVTRNLPLWCSAVPELSKQINETVFCLNSPQASYFTEGNLPKGVYNNIVFIIKKHNE